MYVFVRKDLPLNQQIVQSTHAAIQMTNLFPSRDPYLVVLEVENQHELLRAKVRLDEIGIECVPFYETDYDLGFTAAATRAVSQKERRHLKDYKLWRE